MGSTGFKSSLTMTFIGTATAILDVNGVRFLTDPFFSPAGTEFDMGLAVLKNEESPALRLQDLPPIDAILLSHEDHPDNLDPLGRQLLNGRHVLTTMDGASKLAPRPAVRGLEPWETVTLSLGGKIFEITGTPCQHLPGGECTGFIITTEEFGIGENGLPNAIYFSGDTVYLEEFKRIPEKWNITAAILNFGNATPVLPDGPVQITFDGKQGAHMFRVLKADVLIPMHFDAWGHFEQKGVELRSVLIEEGINDKVQWLEPGKPQRIL
jgi:L-ascorbate metabolism protein UlaG (beta-lactamase superfamily)